MKAYKWKVLGKVRGESGKVKGEKEASSTSLGREVKGQDLIDILLENRGIKTKKEREKFLNSTLESVSLDSVEIDKQEVEKSLERIKQAIENNEKIIVYGDYDVDGICGTAILWETIYSNYKNVEPYIPHRTREGYGLSIKGIENILNGTPSPKPSPARGEGDQSKVIKNKVGLIITVDNGIVANDAVKFANEKGIDIVITDHHVRSDKDPEAYSIVHTTKLCGTGVAYLLAQEISNFQFTISNRDQDPKSKIQDLNNHLELVALATVADLVPLVGANRALLKFGLSKLRTTNRPGLNALFDEAKIKKEEIDTYHIGHIIAPRLNASGRITHALDSLRLICTKDPTRAKQLANNLGQVNRDRQNYTSESTIHADIAVDINDKFIFVAHADYEEGVIGLVASRLVEKHYKPAIAISIGTEISKGSARSIKGFNMIEFLRTFESHMVNVGGHPMAAGFTIETGKLEEFRIALTSKASELISQELLDRILFIDLEIEFDAINMDFYKNLKSLAPFGMGNSEPTFTTTNVILEDVRAVGKDKKHLKLVLSKDGRKIDAIYFNGMEAGLKIGDTINIAYTINNDTWNGNNKLDLKIKDIVSNNA